jgi:hypothetical protein
MTRHTRIIGRQLGSEQRRFLETLVEHGYWYAGGMGCGWLWGSPSQTLRLCESLFKRGLVTKEAHPSQFRKDATVTHYVPSAAGAAMVAEWRLERAARKAQQAGAAVLERNRAICGFCQELQKTNPGEWCIAHRDDDGDGGAA